MVVKTTHPRKVPLKSNFILWVDDDKRIVDNIASIMKKRFNIYWHILYGD